jgi:hypothetical protein
MLIPFFLGTSAGLAQDWRGTGALRGSAPVATP